MKSVLIITGRIEKEIECIHVKKLVYSYTKIYNKKKKKIMIPNQWRVEEKKRKTKGKIKMFDNNELEGDVEWVKLRRGYMKKKKHIKEGLG